MRTTPLKLLVLVGTAILVSSCTNKPSTNLNDDLSPEQYLEMAATADPLKKTSYELAAADKFISQQKSNQAQLVLENITPELSPIQSIHKQLLQARITLLKGDPKQALALLSTLQNNYSALSNTQKIYLNRLLANTYITLGQPIQSIQTRINLNPLITDEQEQHLNLIAIWHTLQVLPNNVIQQAIQSHSNETELLGWLKLVLITRQAKTPNALMNGVKDWKQHFNNHAAITLLPKDLTTVANNTQRPNTIALLLPLTGRYAQAGNAIHNGFLAAYYAAEKHQLSMPHLRVYDTTKGSILTAYQQAITDHANFIIGPLLKKNIQKLLNNSALQVPTLALNTLSYQKKHRYLYQFGLSPFDESYQVAKKAEQLKYNRVAVVIDNSPWGQDIAKVFLENRNKAGYQDIKLTLNSTQSRSQQLALLLGISASEHNAAALRMLIHRKIRFIPRRRKDIDMIYLVTRPTQTHEIIPLLKYYFAGNIPTYILSQIYSGRRSTTNNQDLNGAYLFDMPWVLLKDNGQQLNLIRQQITTVWPSASAKEPKFYALGIDAFTIANKLSQMKALPQFGIVGATGILYLDQTNHIFRNLLWAQFKHSTPVLLK